MTTQEIKKIVNEKYQNEYNNFLSVMLESVNLESVKFCNPELTINDIDSDTSLKSFYALISVFNK